MKLPPLPQIPRPLRLALWILVPASLVPLAIIANSRASLSDKPRKQLFQGMGQQPRLAAQAVSAVFDDGRAMRQPVLGTIARGKLTRPDHYHLGYVPNVTVVDPETGKLIKKYHDGYPPGLELDAALLRRGQERYNIYCAPCHATSGNGNGMVHKRAVKLETATWVQPTNLHSEDVIKMPEGQLFDTITNGARTMPSYAAQIPVADRWAITSYIEALQLSQRAPVEAVPEAQRKK